MTIFHVIKYPLSNPYTVKEICSIPAEIWENLNKKYTNISRSTPDEILKMLKETLVNYEGTDDDISCN